MKKNKILSGVRSRDIHQTQYEIGIVLLLILISLFYPYQETQDQIGEARLQSTLFTNTNTSPSGMFSFKLFGFNIFNNEQQNAFSCDSGDEKTNCIITTTKFLNGSLNFVNLTITSTGVINATPANITINVSQNMIVAGTIRDDEKHGRIDIIVGELLNISETGIITSRSISTTKPAGNIINITATTILVSGSINANGRSYDNINIYVIGAPGTILLQSNSTHILGTITSSGVQASDSGNTYGGGIIRINTSYLNLTGRIYAMEMVPVIYRTGSGGGIIHINATTLIINGSINATSRYVEHGRIFLNYSTLSQSAYTSPAYYLVPGMNCLLTPSSQAIINNTRCMQTGNMTVNNLTILGDGLLFTDAQSFNLTIIDTLNLTGGGISHNGSGNMTVTAGGINLNKPFYNLIENSLQGINFNLNNTLIIPPNITLRTTWRRQAKRTETISQTIINMTGNLLVQSDGSIAGNFPGGVDNINSYFTRGLDFKIIANFVKINGTIRSNGHEGSYPGSGGNITIIANDLDLRGQINSQATSSGGLYEGRPGGAIHIIATENITINGSINTNGGYGAAESGSGGIINLTAGKFLNISSSLRAVGAIGVGIAVFAPDGSIFLNFTNLNITSPTDPAYLVMPHRSCEFSNGQQAVLEGRSCILNGTINLGNLTIKNKARIRTINAGINLSVDILNLTPDLQAADRTDHMGGIIHNGTGTAIISAQRIFIEGNSTLVGLFVNSRSLMLKNGVRLGFYEYSHTFIPPPITFNLTESLLIPTNSIMGGFFGGTRNFANAITIPLFSITANQILINGTLIGEPQSPNGAGFGIPSNISITANTLDIRGSITANAKIGKASRIFINASTVNITGSISANGAGIGGSGGNINITSISLIINGTLSATNSSNAAAPTGNITLEFQNFINITNASIKPFPNIAKANQFGRIQINRVNYSGIEFADTTRFNISNNKAFANTTLEPKLNASGTIILNLSYTTPQPIVDFEDDNIFTSCPQSICQNTSNTAGLFKFDVTHFTTYSAQETGCGSIFTNITLNQNMSVNGSCFILKADNIFFDCNGFSIRGNGLGTLLNISDNLKDVTVRNCELKNSSISISIGKNVNNSIISNVVADSVTLEKNDNFPSYNNIIQLSRIDSISEGSRFDTISLIHNVISKSLNITSPGGFLINNTINCSIFCELGSQWTIINNTLINGIFSVKGNDIIVNNTFIGTKVSTGIRQGSTTGLFQFTDNNISNIAGGCLSLSINGPLIINNNRFTNCTTGIVINAAQTLAPRLIHNTFLNIDTTGIDLLGAMIGAQITDNLFSVVGIGGYFRSALSLSAANSTLFENNTILRSPNFVILSGELNNTMIRRNILGNSTDRGITFGSGNIIGLTIQNNSFSSLPGTGSDCIEDFIPGNRNINNTLIQDNIFIGCDRYAISFGNSGFRENTTIIANTYLSNTNLLTQTGAYALDLRGSNLSKLFILGNIFNNSRTLITGNANTIILANNTIINPNEGIVISHSQNVVVKDTRIANTSIALQIANITNLSIDHINITSSMLGINLSTGKNNIISDITFENMHGTSLYLTDTLNTTITNTLAPPPVLIESWARSSINYTAKTNFSLKVPLLTYINLTMNHIFVNSTYAPGLNTSAILRMNSSQAQGTMPGRDADDNGMFVECPNYMCSQVSNLKDTVIFNVKSFTTYRLDAATRFSCSGSPRCTESWSCTPFQPTTCPTNRKRTRTCTDTNDCGTTKNKPEEIETCTCTESWSCTSFGTCLNNIQTRICTDNNNCGTTSTKPTQQQQCLLDLIIDNQNVILNGTLGPYNKVILRNNTLIQVQQFSNSTGGTLTIIAKHILIDHTQIQANGIGHTAGTGPGLGSDPPTSFCCEGCAGTTHDDNFCSGGGGAGHATQGESTQAAPGGTTYGNPDLPTLELGSGGGRGSSMQHCTLATRRNPCSGPIQTFGGEGGSGGGGIKLIADTIELRSAQINANGDKGNDSSLVSEKRAFGGGGGSGGSIYLIGNVSLDATSSIATQGGIGGIGWNARAGGGGYGRIKIQGILNNKGSISPSLVITA